MRAEEKYRGVFVKGFLRAVPMMHIPIDDRNPFESMPFLKIACRDRHVIEQTESHGMGRFSMMPGWPQGTEGIVYARLDDRVGRRQRTPDRRVGGIQGAGRNHGVGIQCNASR